MSHFRKELKGNFVESSSNKQEYVQEVALSNRNINESK